MPVETGGALALVYKVAALFLGSAAAAYIVMAMQRPQDDREWKQALFVTVLFSVCGSAPATHYVSSGIMDAQIPAAIVGATISDLAASDAIAAAGLQIIRPPIVW